MNRSGRVPPRACGPITGKDTPFLWQFNGTSLNVLADYRRELGADATVGMGSVVLDDVPAGETWVGVPARPIRTGVHA